MDPKKLIKLNFYKSTNQEYHCPVLYKVFTKQSHMVAVSKTGNVFSYEVSKLYFFIEFQGKEKGNLYDLNVFFE